MMKRLLILYFILLFSQSQITAAEGSLTCFNEIESSFFQPVTVSEALQLYNVYQSLWNPFNSALAKNAREIPRLVQEKAERMSPNPLGYPFQAKQAAILLNQVLFAVFDRTIKQFNLGKLSSSNFDQSAINGMYRYIRSKQASRLKACFGEDIMKELSKYP